MNKGNQRGSKSSTKLQFREPQKPWHSQRMGFSSFFSHCPSLAKAISGLLGVSGNFPKKSLCYLSDRVAYNPFSEVSVELKNINLIIRETPLLHFPVLAPPFWCNQEWHRNLIAPAVSVLQQPELFRFPHKYHNSIFLSLYTFLAEQFCCDSRAVQENIPNGFPIPE